MVTFKHIALPLIAVMGLGIAGCLPMNYIDVTAANNGSELQVPLNQGLRVTLDSNATTGYAWEIDSVDDTILDLADHNYLAPTTSAVGAGGSEVYLFTAIGTGTTNLKMVYIQSFDPEQTPAETFEIEVTVPAP